MSCHVSSRLLKKKPLEIWNICFLDFWVWNVDIMHMYVSGVLKESFSPPEVSAQTPCVGLRDPNMLTCVQGWK